MPPKGKKKEKQPKEDVADTLPEKTEPTEREIQLKFQ